MFRLTLSVQSSDAWTRAICVLLWVTVAMKLSSALPPVWNCLLTIRHQRTLLCSSLLCVQSRILPLAAGWRSLLSWSPSDFPADPLKNTEVILELTASVWSLKWPFITSMSVFLFLAPMSSLFFFPPFLSYSFIQFAMCSHSPQKTAETQSFDGVKRL